LEIVCIFTAIFNSVDAWQKPIASPTQNFSS